MNVSLKWLGTLVDIKGLDPEIAAAYGRHRSVYSPEGYPVWRKKGRNNGRYASAFIHYPAVKLKRSRKQSLYRTVPTKLISGKWEIYHSHNNIVIDCGAAFGGRLACLRLEDMAEFYL